MIRCMVCLALALAKETLALEERSKLQRLFGGDAEGTENAASAGLSDLKPSGPRKRRATRGGRNKHASAKAPAYKPTDPPLEYVLGGAGVRVHTALIILPGVTAQGTDYFHSSKKFLEDGGVEAGTRVVLASPGTTSDPGWLQFVNKKEPIPSWFDQTKGVVGLLKLEPMWHGGKVNKDNFRQGSKSGFDWTAPDLVKPTEYVQSLIRDQIERGVKANRVFVVPHSQGGPIGCRAAMTFPDATLGGLIMTSSFHGSLDLEESTAKAQRGKLKVLAGTSPDDKFLAIPVVVEMYEAVKAVVGEQNFVYVEEDDNKPPMYHGAFASKKLEKAVADMLKRK